MKHSILLFLIISFTNENVGLERRNGVMTRIQLRAQQPQEWQEKDQEWRSQAKHTGMRTILEYIPMCAVGACLFVNSLYRISNLEQKCWVQTPTITQEECDLLKQCACGAALCITSSGCFGKGCDDLCEARICSEDNWCRECCSVGMQECCWLLGMRYK